MYCHARVAVSYCDARGLHCCLVSALWLVPTCKPGTGAGVCGLVALVWSLCLCGACGAPLAVQPLLAPAACEAQQGVEEVGDANHHMQGADVARQSATQLPPEPRTHCPACELRLQCRLYCRSV
jgi:hypothetical protein